MPIFVLSVIILGFLNLVLFHRAFGWADGRFIVLEACIMVVYCASYIGIIAVGPGYLPYYYPYHCGDRDGLSGVVSNREQMEWVQTQQHPPHVKFFRKARRLVIRADHYCFWSSCFIGRRNFKFFCLFNFWGALYILGYAVWNIKGLHRLWNNFPYPYELSSCIIFAYLSVSMIIAGFFLTFQCIFIFSNWFAIWFNLTQYDVHHRKKLGIYRLDRVSPVATCEYFFGPCSRWYTFCLPITAFPGMHDSELVEFI